MYNSKQSKFYTLHGKNGNSTISTLRPLLFLLFINDLPLASSFKTTLFVDDAMLSISSTSMTNLKRKPTLNFSKLKIGYGIINYLAID